MRTPLSFSHVLFFVAVTAVIGASACDPPAVIDGGGAREGEGEGDVDDGDCDADADCNGGEVCEGGACVRVCDEDADCAGGFFCDNDRCVKPDCVDDAGCPGGFFCDDNHVCAAINGGCVDGDVRCLDDHTVATCEAGREVLAACGDSVCVFGVCVGDVGEGEGEGEGDAGEGEGEGEGVCVESCLDSGHERVCFLGAPFDQACGSGQVCDDARGGCVDVDACVPDCGSRVCGADPVCGESCGTCTDTCTTDGRCIRDNPNPNSAHIEVIVSPVDNGFYPWLSRRTSGDFCDVDDSCGFRNCAAGSGIRPNWDGDRSSTLGDPLYTRSTGTLDVTTPSSAQTYRVAVQHPLDSDAAGTVTLNIAVDGVNVFGASKRLNPGDLWTGITIAWNGTSATVTRADVVQTGFSCGGEACTGGVDCSDGYVCTLTTFNNQTTGVCNACDDQTPCGAGEECRTNFCLTDTTDRQRGASCVTDVDCVDGVDCVGDGICGEACEPLFCAFLPDLCCTDVPGTSCNNGVCL